MNLPGFMGDESLVFYRNSLLACTNENSIILNALIITPTAAHGIKT
jgi:hypothetical protein